MSGIAAFIAMTLRTRARRLAGLGAFAMLFIAAAATARLMTGTREGHIDMDLMFRFGGSALISAVLLLGWIIGRFGIIAALVLMSGVFSEDHATRRARLYAVRPTSLLALYGARALVLGLFAFAISAVLLPIFDFIVLGHFAGPTIFLLIAAHVLVYGSVTALLSTLTRADAWAALFAGILAMIWAALRRAEFFATAPPLIRDGLAVILPPQSALTRIEAAFATLQPVPWDAFLYVCLYTALVLLLAGVLLVRKSL